MWSLFSPFNSPDGKPVVPGASADPFVAVPDLATTLPVALPSPARPSIKLPVESSTAIPQPTTVAPVIIQRAFDLPDMRVDMDPNKPVDPQLLADLRNRNARMREHLQDELDKYRKLSSELGLVRLKVDSATQQMAALKIREVALIKEHREVEEKVHAVQQQVSKMNKSGMKLEEELSDAKTRYIASWRKLEAARRGLLRVEKEKQGAEDAAGPMGREEISADFYDPRDADHSIGTQTVVDLSALEELDFLLEDCQNQTKVLAKLKLVVKNMIE